MFFEREHKNMIDKIRCAIIGTGTMGRRYAAMLDGGLIEDMCLSAVC